MFKIALDYLAMSMGVLPISSLYVTSCKMSLAPIDWNLWTM